MVFEREVLGEVTGKVFSSLLPVEAELVLFYAVAHPVEAHVKIFGALTAHVAVRMPWDVALSVLIGVGGCGWTISMSAVRMGTSCLPLRNIAPVSASAAEAMTVRML